MKVTATVVVEIDDDSYQRVSAMFRDVTPQSLVHTLLTTGLDREISANGGILGYAVNVEDYVSPVGGVYETSGKPQIDPDYPFPNKRSNAPESVSERSGGMSGGARKSVPSGKRMGRPKTLTHLEASDGQPVRERGNRSPEELHAAGISTRPVGGTDSDWTPPRAPKPERKPKTSPVSKGYRPPVVARQRGK